MKVGIVGTGAVGSACTLALIGRGCAREIVLLDKVRERAQAVATDIRYGIPLLPETEIRDGGYEDLTGAALVMVTAGINEKTGGATDRTDPAGRLELLDANARIFGSIVPQIVAATPEAVILVVTDPPDPLADLARHLAGHDRVISTGTFLDSLRFRVHLAQRLGVSPASIEAQVVGEHGASEVFLWSAARVAGIPVVEAFAARGHPAEAFRQAVEHDVRYANITIIVGNDASQFGIGMVSARLAEIILRDERAVIPIGCHNAKYGVTLSLPSVLGRRGVVEALDPPMSDAEEQGLQRSAEKLRVAVQRMRDRRLWLRRPMRKARIVLCRRVAAAAQESAQDPQKIWWEHPHEGDRNKMGKGRNPSRTPERAHRSSRVKHVGLSRSNVRGRKCKMLAIDWDGFTSPRPPPDRPGIGGVAEGARFRLEVTRNRLKW